MARRERAVVVGILFVVALVLRLGYVATTEVDGPLRADAGQYSTCAHNLLAHGTLSIDTGPAPRPDSFRSPGYPAFLALVLAGAGEARFVAAVSFVQAVLGALAVLVVYRLARRHVRPAWALAATALTALSPHLVTSTGYVLSEALSVPCLAVALLLYGRCSSRGHWLRGVAAGAVFGAATLVNESLGAVPLLLFAWLMREKGSRRVAIAFLAAYAALAGGWQLRSALVVPPGAPTSGARVLATLSHGTYPGLFFATERHRYYPYQEDPEQPQFGRSWGRFAAVLGARIGERPLRYASWYLLEKPFWLWGWSIVQGRGDVYVYPVRTSLYETQPVAAATKAVMWLLHVPCLGLLLVALSRRRVPFAIAGTLAWLTVVYTLSMPDPRYLTPAKPLLYIAAAIGAAALLDRRGAAAAGAAGRPAAAEAPAERPGAEERSACGGEGGGAPRGVCEGAREGVREPEPTRS